MTLSSYSDYLGARSAGMVSLLLKRDWDSLSSSDGNTTATGSSQNLSGGEDVSPPKILSNDAQAEAEAIRRSEIINTLTRAVSWVQSCQLS
jgi:hypothetical protein